MEKAALNFVLVGVGGQGTILASDVLAELGLKLGYDVKKAEVHGMSQRGGSVVSHLRWGPQVFAPVIARGEADFLVAFEKLEAARFVDLLRPGGTVLVNDYAITPATVNAGSAVYPPDEALQAALAAAGARPVWVRGAEIAEGLGNAKVANVVLLGALSGLLPKVDDAAWDEVLALRVPPKYLELNRKAFQAGRGAVRA
ncbi:MAG TPA: indolepyruvate oxidoreductase subunit beta [Polyangia bacterium]